MQSDADNPNDRAVRRRQYVKHTKGNEEQSPPVYVQDTTLSTAKTIVEQDDRTLAEANDGATLGRSSLSSDESNPLSLTRGRLSSAWKSWTRFPKGFPGLIYYAASSRYGGARSEGDLEKRIRLLTIALEHLPPGHPTRRSSQMKLSEALARRYDISGALDDLELIVSSLTEVLDNLSTNHSDRGFFLNKLARTLGIRYDRTGSQDDLIKSIRLHTEALSLCPLGHTNRDIALDNLATALGTQLKVKSSENDLARMIDLQSEALELRPSGHENRQSSLSGLAIALKLRYDQSGLLEDLERSIQLHEEALDLTPPGHSMRSDALSNFGNALCERYYRVGEVTDLTKAIQLLTKALELRPPGHSYRGAALNNLAGSLKRRFDREGENGDLERLVRLYEEALELHKPGHPYRSSSLNNLAAALIERYQRTSSEVDLNRTIALHTEALGLRPLGHPDRDSSLTGLAIALSYQYDRSGGEDILERNIQLLTSALSLQPTGNPYRGTTLNSLAATFNKRYNSSGSQSDLDRTIRLHSEALDCRPIGHPYRSISLHNLAVALGKRYERTGSQSDLDEVIKIRMEALGLCTHNHPDRSSCLNSLANALDYRYSRTGKHEDLEIMIELHREALDLKSPGHIGRSASLNNLANALNARYRRFGSQDDLMEHIALLQEAVRLNPPSHSDRASFLSNLANALRDRYNLLRQEEDLEEAIELHTEALHLRVPGHPERHVSLHNLALAFGTRYYKNGEQQDLDRLVQSLSEALRIMASNHSQRDICLNNLADALGDRYARTKSQDDFNESVRLYREALQLRPPGHLRRATAMLHFAWLLWRSKRSAPELDELFQLLKEGTIDRFAPLDVSLICVRYWVEWAREVRHDTLGDAYSHFVQFFRRYLTIGPTVKLQYDALLKQRHILTAPMDAAAYAINNGQIEMAVELLDSGRSLLWTEMRRFREQLVQPELVGGELVRKFEETKSKLQELSTEESMNYSYSSARDEGLYDIQLNASPSTGITYDALLTQKRKLLEEYDEVVEQIRSKPGCECFLRSPPFNELQKAAREGPVVIVNCSKHHGSHAIIVFSDKRPSVISLDDNFFEIASTIHIQYMTARTSTNGGTRSSAFFNDRLGRVARQLWVLVVSDVVEELEKASVPEESRIWWCPTSVLSMLPLHAAGVGRNHLINHYISSYTPTLKALIDSRIPSPLHVPTKMETHPRLLVIAQTSSNLASAKSELDVVRSLGTFVECLDAQEATRASVLEGLQSHNWVHFICHGTVSASPFDSKLHLFGGDTLSLNDIIKAHLPNAEFAFLAACQTAEQPHNGLRDEILHLAGAMQFSGFRSVVGTMWEMEDGDGPLVARKFYEEMMGEGDVGKRHTRAARALWNVTRKMRRGKGMTLDRWINFVHIGA